ncbi:MAG: DNA polymerase III subunit delta [Lachnospiraceae bacterium]|nr:DNA polymerase III subunit delta [Lachnospiraceae bacterium]
MKKDAKTPDWVAKDIKSGEFKNLYLICGSEEYLKKNRMRQLIHALAPDADEMNLAEFDGKKTEAESIISLADTLPFFADRRVVAVTESGYFKKGCEALEEYIAGMPETTYLIFCEKEIDKKRKLYKYFNENGHVTEYEPLDEEGLRMYVVPMLKKLNKTILGSTFSYLIQRTGCDLNNISNELQKLAAYTGERAEITPDDIDRLVCRQLEEQVFDLTDAIASKQCRKALDLYYEMLELKTPPMRIISLLSGQYNSLMQLKELRMKGMDENEISKKAGLHPYAVKMRLRTAARFELKELKKALVLCVEAEEAIKQGRKSQDLAAETLIVTLSRQA